MALISCLDCGNELSDKAHGCPHCGRPYKGRGLHRRFSHTELLIIILAALVVWNLIPVLVTLLA